MRVKVCVNVLMYSAGSALAVGMKQTAGRFLRVSLSM
jgi:hypothetical protein